MAKSFHFQAEAQAYLVALTFAAVLLRAFPGSHGLGLLRVTLLVKVQGSHAAQRITY
jgi:hypothetical protein